MIKDLTERLERIEAKLDRLLEGTEKPLDIEQAARYLRISKNRLYHLTSSGTIAHYKPGKRIFFYKRDLDAYVMTKRRASNEELETQAERNIHELGSMHRGRSTRGRAAPLPQLNR